MQVKTAAARVGKAFNSVSKTSKSVRMSPIELFAHPTVSMKDLQRRRGNCAKPQNRRPTMPKYAHSPPFPPGPFLRRQESHSVVPPNAAGEGRCPLRFLPTQEWSTCVRTIVDEYGVVCIHNTVRFLLPQEWSVEERQNPHTLPSPRRPFLRRQESHSVVPAAIGKNPPFRRNCPPPLSTISSPYPQINARNLPCLFATPPLMRNFPLSPPPLQNRQSPRQSRRHR